MATYLANICHRGTVDVNKSLRKIFLKEVALPITGSSVKLGITHHSLAHECL